MGASRIRSGLSPEACTSSSLGPLSLVDSLSILLGLPCVQGICFSVDYFGTWSYCPNWETSLSQLLTFGGLSLADKKHSQDTSVHTLGSPVSHAWEAVLVS